MRADNEYFQRSKAILTLWIFRIFFYVRYSVLKEFVLKLRNNNTALFLVHTMIGSIHSTLRVSDAVVMIFISTGCHGLNQENCKFQSRYYALSVHTKQHSQSSSNWNG